MTKCKFYIRKTYASWIIEGHRNGVCLVAGYTDGTFNYYNTQVNNLWIAIDPHTGLSLCMDSTRAEAQQRVWGCIHNYNRILKTKEYIEAQHRFKEMIAKHERNK